MFGVISVFLCFETGAVTVPGLSAQHTGIPHPAVGLGASPVVALIDKIGMLRNVDGFAGLAFGPVTPFTFPACTIRLIREVSVLGHDNGDTAVFFRPVAAITFPVRPVGFARE